MDYAVIYNRLVPLHALLPYYLLGGRALSPFRIQLEVTYSCNLRCHYCYQDIEYKKSNEELTLQDIKNILSQIPRFSLVTLSGGEPLHRKDFPEILRYALEKHWCNLLTNCVLLSKENTNLMVDGGLLLLGASIDGIGELQNELRGGKIFDKIIDNLRYLQRYKKERSKNFPLLDIKTLIMPQNVSSLADIYELATDLGADYFTLSLPKASEVQFNPRLFTEIENPVFYKKRDIAVGIDQHTLAESLARICELSEGNRTKVRVYPRIEDIRMFDALFDNKTQMTEKYAACCEPWSSMNISAKGEAYPCLSYQVGNIRDSTLMGIWNSQRYKDFRNRLRELKLFPACESCCYLKLNQGRK